MPYRPEYTIEINPNFGRTTGFGKVETRHILIAILALSASFTLLYMRNKGFFSSNFFTNTICWFVFSLVAVTFSFFLHELGHKFVAQKMGSWAEFRMFPAGLLLGIVMAMFGFLIAAPGAVMISGRIDERENGLISIAGPAVNGVLALLFMMLSLITSGHVMLLLHLIAHLNIVLALFNMIPISPFDGSKIFRWNRQIYFATAVVLVVILVILNVI